MVFDARKLGAVPADESAGKDQGLTVSPGFDARKMGAVPVEEQHQGGGIIDAALDKAAKFVGGGLKHSPGVVGQVAGELLSGTNDNQEDPGYRTWGEAAQDTGVAVAKGGVEFARGANEISRYTPAGRIQGLMLGDNEPDAQDTLERDYLAPASEYWQDSKSAGLQEQERLVHDADGFLGTMGAAVDNPGVIMSVVSEQALPTMLQMGLSAKAAQGLISAAGAKAASGTATAFEGVQAGGAAGVDVRGFMQQVPIEALRENPEFEALEQEHGEAGAREVMADRLAPVAASIAGASTMLISKYLGDGSRIAGLVVGDGQKGVMAGARRVGGEILSEGIQEPAEGAATDFAKSMVDDSINPMDLSERGSDAALGMMAGGGQAAGIEIGRAGLSRYRQGLAPDGGPDPEQVPDISEQLDTLNDTETAQAEPVEPERQLTSLDDILRAHGVEPAKAPEWTPQQNEAAVQPRRKTLLDSLKEQYGRSSQGQESSSSPEYRGPAQIMQERGLSLGGANEPEAAKPSGTVQRLVEENRARRQEQARRESEVAPYSDVLEQLQRENGSRKKDGVDVERDDILTAISKLGGLDPDQLGGEVDVATMRKMSRVGRPVVRGKGQGLTMDHMAESLSQEGFTAPDGGPLDPNTLAEALDNASRGESTYAAASNRDGMVDPDGEIARRWFSGDDAKVANALRKYIDGKPLTANQQGAVDDITDYLRGNDGSIYRERDVAAAQGMDPLSGELPKWYGEIGDMEPADMVSLAEDAADSSIAGAVDAGDMEWNEAFEHGQSRALLDVGEYSNPAQGTSLEGVDTLIADHMLKAARAGASNADIAAVIDRANGSRMAAVGGLIALEQGMDPADSEPLSAIDWRYERMMGAEPAGENDGQTPPVSTYQDSADGSGSSEERGLSLDRPGPEGRSVEAEPEPEASSPPVTEPTNKSTEAPADAGVSGSGGQEMSVDEAVRHRIKVAQQEIESDIANGTIPADVSSFSGLHDHVDANEYVNDAEREDRVFGPAGKRAGFGAQEFTEHTGRMIDALDAWLVDGRKGNAVDHLDAKTNEPALWKKDGKKVWRGDNGMIITDESMTVGGNRIKSFFVYANANERDRGNNFASAESYAEAKRKAEAGESLELEQQTEEQLAKQDKVKKAAAKQAENDDAQAEQRRKADNEAKDFRLSGSDRQADVAAAGGQNDMFGAAASEADPAPTEAQKEAGNYKKGHIRFQGLDIAIENARGSKRSGTAPDGTQWESEMAHHYGYIKRTEGADGDHVDVFIGTDEDSDRVFVIDQIDENGNFDEHKVMLGFPNQKAARDGYKANYDKGWKVGPTTAMSMDEFKAWLANDDTTKPIQAEAVGTPKKGAKATAPEHSAQHDDLEGVSPEELTQMVQAFAEAGQITADEEVTKVFAAPKKSEIVRLNDKVKVYHKDHGWMTPDEAKKVVAEWKENARKQGIENRSQNADKVVLSFFDYTGSWSKPWEEAGYQVWRFDIQTDPEVGDINNFSTDFFNDWFGSFDGNDVYAILAACPCTDFASSGARHFAAKDADGRTIKSIRLVRKTLAAIEYFKPAVWALENPVGRIEKLGGLPPWRLSFDPNHLGEDYTKKTLIWGRFNADLPIAPTEPTEGSKMHRKYGGKSIATKNARSETPEGFSYGFFQANNAVDNPVLAIGNKYDQLDLKVVKQAVDAGMTEQDISEVVDDYYYQDMDFDAANADLREAAKGWEKEEPETVAQSRPIESVGAYGDDSLDLRRAQDKMQSIERELTADDIARMPLSKIWPKKEVDALEDKAMAAFATIFRGMIPNKPRQRYRLQKWVAEVQLARDMMQAYMDRGPVVMARLAENPKLKSVRDRIQILGELDRADWGRVEGASLHPDAYTFDDKGDKVPRPFGTVNVDGRRITVKGAKTVADLMDPIREALGESKPATDSKMKFTIRGREGFYFIHKEGDPEYRHLKTFTDVPSARDFVRNNHSDLVAEWEKVKERDNVRKTDVRQKKNRERIGADHRNGRDVSVEEFHSAFGLRHVDWGNWVSDKNGERQGHLNRAYDAFMDLAAIAGIPPKAIGLNGDLIITFGKRGSGTASAHFEAGQQVINLTKTSGAGSLAHEWFHALDNYFQRSRTNAAPANSREASFVTYSPETHYVHKTRGNRIPAEKFEQALRGDKMAGIYVQNPDDWVKVEGVRPEVEAALAKLVETLDSSPMRGRARAIDQGKSDGYWSRIIERAARSFENYVIAKMQESGQHNDYLANVASIEAFHRNPDRYPYLLDSEMEPVKAAFDDLFNVIESRETDSGTALYSVAEAKPEGLDRRSRSILGDDNLLAAWTALATDDDAFQLPVSDATTIEGVFDDTQWGDKALQVRRFSVLDDGNTKTWIIHQVEPDGSRTLQPNGRARTATFYDDGKRVWLDVSEWGEGGGGSHLYSRLANYAHNTGKVFIGDPAGLSDIGMARRLENMISSALKFGTTDHLAPHDRQIQGSNGVPPLNWKPGNFVHNLREMLKASMTAAERQFPEISNLQYNPDKDAFEDTVSGETWNAEDFDNLAEQLRSDAAAAGSSKSSQPGRSGASGPVTTGGKTLERAVVGLTILRSESESGSGRGRVGRRILARFGSVGSKRLTGKKNAALYSNTTEARPSAGLSASGLKTALRNAVGKRLADSIEVVQSAGDLPASAGLESLSGHSDVQAFARSLRDEFPGLKLSLGGRDQNVTLHRIELPSDLRESGAGTQVMQRIMEWADAGGITVALSPTADFGGSKRRLAGFYKRFGFTNNAGANKNYAISETMYRSPDSSGAAGAEAVELNSEGDVGKVETGKPVSFWYRHNTQSATDIWGMPSEGDQFSRDKEPSGRYMTIGGKESVSSLADEAGWETGRITLRNPLVVDVDGWKPALSERYSGKTGKRLSQALIKDGYDGVITVDRGGRHHYVSEVLDLQSFDAKKARYSTNDRVEGMFDPATGKVYLVADGLSSEERAAWVAWHELWHRGIRSIDGKPGKMPGSPEGNALNQAINRAGLNKSVKDLADAIMRDRGMTASQRRVAVEEALAELNAADETGDYSAIEHRYGVKVPAGMRSGIRGHIQRFLDAVRGVLAKLLNRSPERVSDAEVWQILTGARDGYSGPPGPGGEPLFSATSDSPSATGSPAFRRWFGDSKVVDENGKPKVVYHGTDGDFDTFSEEFYGEATGVGDLGEGFYFTDRPDIASDFAGQSSPSVMPVYLDIKNPATNDAMQSDEVLSAIDDDMGFVETREVLESLGYDGVIYDHGEQGGVEYVAFRPEQIKSVNNRGTFDPDSPNVLFSVAEDGHPETEAGERQRKFLKGILSQPIDRMFRLPFDALGMIDARGRLKGGVSIDNAARNILTSWKPNPEGRFGWMDGILESARAGLLDRYGLSAEYKQRWREAESEIRQRLGEASDLFSTTLAGMSTSEAKVLQSILTGEQIAEGDWAQVSEPVRRAIDEMGQEAVRLGLITAESYNRNKGKYLHRSYLKHEAQFTGLSRFANNLSNKARRRIQGDSLKARGIEAKVSMQDIKRSVPAEWWQTKMEEGKADPSLTGSQFILLEKLAPIGEGVDTLASIEEGGPRKRKVLDRHYWPADKPLPAKYEAWENRGVWEVRGTRGDNLVLWRDYTKAERARMGEIVDARYNIVKTFETLSHDLAMGRFFSDVAKNTAWFQRNEPAGGPDGEPVIVDANEAGRLATFAGVDWVKVPETSVGGAEGAKKWGAMAGGYVRAEIWRDLNELDKMHASGTWRSILNQWKLNKTVRSPVVHMNNVMSNLMFMDLADVRVADLVAGIHAYVTDSDEYKDALVHGAFEANFAKQELNRKILQPILDELVAQNLRDNDPKSSLAALSKLGYGIARQLKRFDNALVSAYEIEDEVFRMATFLRRRAMGDNAQEAAAAAREQFLDYDIRAPWVNAARRTVLPFISYTYRAVPVVAQSILHRPWKLAKYYTIAYMANMLAYSLAPGDEDEERRTMQESQQGYTWLGVPRMARMPWRDEHGNPVFLDVRRWVPAGDVFDTNVGNTAVPVPSPLQWGGPLMLGAELALNKVAFTGKPITDPQTDTGGDMAGKVASWAWKSWMPSAAYIPGSWYWDKTWKAVEGGRDIMGRPYSVSQALASSVGVKVQPHDVQMGYAFRSFDLKDGERTLRYQARRLAGDKQRGLISSEVFKREMQHIEEKMRRIEQKARELQGMD